MRMTTTTAVVLGGPRHREQHSAGRHVRNDDLVPVHGLPGGLLLLLLRIVAFYYYGGVESRDGCALIVKVAPDKGARAVVGPFALALRVALDARPPAIGLERFKLGFTLFVPLGGGVTCVSGRGGGGGTCLSAGLAALFVCEFAGVWEGGGCGRLCGCCLLARAKTRHCSVGVVVEELGCGDVNVCSSV
jgi:hypothetical protein